MSSAIRRAFQGLGAPVQTGSLGREADNAPSTEFTSISSIKKTAPPARSFQQPAEADRLATANKNLDELGIMLPALRNKILQDPDLVTQLFKYVLDLKTGKVKAAKNPGGLFLTMINLRPRARKTT